MNNPTTTSHNKNILYIVLATGVVLLIPLIAMQFSSEVNWTLLDFVVAGALLFITGLAYELISRKLLSPIQRIITAIVLAALLFMIWVELAVGIFD